MYIETILKAISKWIFDQPGKLQLNIHDSLTNKKVLLAIRMVALLVLTARIGYEFYYCSSIFKMVQYLTQVGFSFTWLYFACVIEDYFLNELSSHQRSIKLKDWITLLYEISICLQVPIVGMFWSILFDYSQPEKGMDLVMEIGIHGFPLICLLFDQFFNIYQFRNRHLIVVIAAGLAYLVVNLGYSLAIEPIYDPIDWVSAMCYVYVAGCVVLVIVVHVVIRCYWQKYRQPLIIKRLEINKLHELFFKNSTQNNLDY